MENLTYGQSLEQYIEDLRDADAVSVRRSRPQ